MIRTTEAADFDENCSARPGVTGIILSYHRIAEAEFDPWGLRVTPELFEQQLSVLREFGEPVSLPHFAASRNSCKMSRPAIVITFDDGYVDNLSAALPLLRNFNAPATIFVSTGYIGKPYFWWEALEHVFLRPSLLPPELNLQHGSVVLSWILGAASDYTAEQYKADCASCEWRGLPDTRLRLYHEVYEALWSTEHEIRLSLVSNIAFWAGKNASSFKDARPMTADELSRLASDELITIGDHSVNHLPLDEIPAPVQEAEILNGRLHLERLLGRPVDTFAYPHGKYSEGTVRLLTDLGFSCACTTRELIATPAMGPMLLPRFTIKNWNREQFREKLATWLAARRCDSTS